MIYTLLQVLFGSLSEEYEVGGRCDLHGGEEEFLQSFGGET